MKHSVHPGSSAGGSTRFLSETLFINFIPYSTRNSSLKARADRRRPYPAISNDSASGTDWSRTEAAARGISISALSAPSVVSVDRVLLPIRNARTMQNETLYHPIHGLYSYEYD